MCNEILIIMVSSIISFLLSKRNAIKDQKYEMKNAIRINGWHSDGINPSVIYIENKGVTIKIIDIKNCDKKCLLVDTSITNKWLLPLDFDSDKQICIPLLRRMAKCPPMSRFEIIVENNKGNIFSCKIIADKNRVYIGDIIYVYKWGKVAKRTTKR